jgi:hypothetical protein
MGGGVAENVAVAVGCACSVSARTAETVSATLISIAPVSTVGAKMGVVGVDESPGTTQAMAPKISVKCKSFASYS